MRKLLTITLALLLAACGASQPMEPTRPTLEPRLEADHARMEDGVRLPLSRWLPAAEPQGVVLALHGFNDYRNAFSELGPYLAERGFATYAYDQRGFGETASRGGWAGAERMVDDAQTLIELLRQRHPRRPVYLLGESMGGAVSMVAAADAAGAEPDGVILVAPAVWARQTMPWYQRAALWVTARVAPDWKPTGKGLGKVASDNIEMLRGLGRDPLVIKKTRIGTVAGLTNLMDRALAASAGLTVPSLVLYGAHDEIIPKTPTCRMLQRLPEPPARDWRFAYYPDGYHMLTRDLQRQVVLEDIAAWLERPRMPLPSGHEATTEWQPQLCARGV